MAVSKDYQNGYDAAIEAIKQHLENMKNNSNSSNSGDGQELDSGMMSPAEATGQGGSGASSGGKQNSGSGDGQKSRTSKGDENQGVVRPEDCGGAMSGELGRTPGTAGGMISQDIGEKIAKAEGYDPERGSESAISKGWEDSALKETDKFAGTLPGNFVDAINALYKVASDWKKSLKKIVGISISPDDKRQAFANKNILVTQDRVARTDKDKYDNLNYIVAFIDSSGSMTLDQLRQCLSEVYAVALAKKPLKIYVIQFDTKIQDIQEFRSVQAVKKYVNKATLHGGGGTDVKCCWELLQTDPKFKRTPAELVMVFTDGGIIKHYKRNPRTMKNLCWVILDHPDWKPQMKDANTKVVYIRTQDIK